MQDGASLIVAAATGVTAGYEDIIPNWSAFRSQYSVQLRQREPRNHGAAAMITHPINRASAVRKRMTALCQITTEQSRHLGRHKAGYERWMLGWPRAGLRAF